MNGQNHEMSEEILRTNLTRFDCDCSKWGNSADVFFSFQITRMNNIWRQAPPQHPMTNVCSVFLRYCVCYGLPIVRHLQKIVYF